MKFPDLKGKTVGDHLSGDLASRTICGLIQGLGVHARAFCRLIRGGGAHIRAFLAHVSEMVGEDISGSKLKVLSLSNQIMMG